MKSIAPLGTITTVDLFAMMLGICITGSKGKSLFAKWARIIRGINTCVFWHAKHCGDESLKLELQASEDEDKRSKTQTLSGLDKAALVHRLELQLKEQHEKKKATTLPQVVTWMQTITFSDKETLSQFTSVKSLGVIRKIHGEFIEDEDVNKWVRQCNFACGAQFVSKHIYKL